MYPFHRVVTPDDLEREPPADLVRMGGREFARYPDGWALVDAGPAVNDNPRCIDDA